MENTNESNYVSSNDSSSEEPTAFPYLLTLEADMELSENEPVETMAQEEEIKETPPKTVATEISYPTTGLPQTNHTTNPTTPTSNTASSTATTPITATMKHENTHSTKETIITMQTQLVDAQKEIASLRHRVELSEVRILEYGQRMLTMEYTLRQLMHMCPNLENTFNAVCNSLAQMTQPSNPVGVNTGADDLDNKRKQEEDSNNNNSPTQHQAKRPMLVKANGAGSRDKAYKGKKPFCAECDSYHKGLCGASCGKCKRHGHQTIDCRVKLCFECGIAGHFRNECPKLKNNNPRDKTFVPNAGEARPNPNNDAGKFLLNN